MRALLVFGLSLALLPLEGCVKDPPAVAPPIVTPSASGVYILNEGLWGRGNSTLSYYDLESFAVTQDIFAAANGRALGDVGNQIVTREGCGYIVVNNSDKIEVIDLLASHSLGTIVLPTGSSPRRMAFVNDTLALVTNLYDNSLSLLDVKLLSVLRRIPVGNNPEGITVIHGKAYVANSGFGAGQTVSVVDLAAWSQVALIGVPDNPSAVLSSPGGLIYVLCVGSYGDFNDPSDDTPACLALIDPLLDSVVDSVFIGGHAAAMAIGQDGIAYVVCTDSIARIDTRTHRNLGAFLRGSYYGVGVEDVTGDVYLSDAKDFSSPGSVRIYSGAGQYRTEFQVGLIPGTFAFNRPK